MAQWQSSSQLPATQHAPALARRLVEVLLDGWGLSDLAADTKQVLSEIVTNAYQHAPGMETFDLEISADAGRVRVSLADGNSVRPVIAELNHDRPRGRGIRIVEAIASRWGAEDENGGKLVWAEITSPATLSDARA